MIDFIFAILMIVAVLKGYQKGLIIALFSILAFIVGLAAALKMSAAVAVRLEHGITGPSKWLPVSSFALVFLAVVLLVNLGGRLIEKTFQMGMLGWANRLGGVIFYLLLYTILFSIFLFYADKLKIIQKPTIDTSKVFPLVSPLGPKVIDGLGRAVPLFKNTFTQLEAFFSDVSNKIQQ